MLATSFLFRGFFENFVHFLFQSSESWANRRSRRWSSEAVRVAETEPELGLSSSFCFDSGCFVATYGTLGIRHRLSNHLFPWLIFGSGSRHHVQRRLMRSHRGLFAYNRCIRRLHTQCCRGRNDDGTWERRRSCNEW